MRSEPVIYASRDQACMGHILGTRHGLGTARSNDRHGGSPGLLIPPGTRPHATSPPATLTPLPHTFSLSHPFPTSQSHTTGSSATPPDATHSQRRRPRCVARISSLPSSL